MQSLRLQLFILLITFSLLLSFPLLAQTAAEHPLTNADIVKMMKAGLPESIIVRAIQTSQTNFQTDAGSLIDLQRRGASEGILGSVLDSRSGGGQPMTGALPFANGQGHSVAAPHHLPNFQADLKIKSHSLAKISMKENQIKVDKAGSPLFELKWKEKPTK
jgi:hypothetical protein